MFSSSLNSIHILPRIETDSSVNLSSAVGCIQLVPKYISKVKLDRGQPPNSLSEIIIPGKNGCCGVNIPISHFLLSLTHSALITSDHLKPDWYKVSKNAKGCNGHGGDAFQVKFNLPPPLLAHCQNTKGCWKLFSF